jgi:DNA polymerase-3 subunit delta'
MKFDISTILVVSSIEKTVNNLIETLPSHSTRVIQNIDGKVEFKKDEAIKAIKEAYISSSEKKYILLCGIFTTIAQNWLLKIFEEPPENIIFILVTTSKSSLLPTVLSRMPYIMMKDKVILNDINLTLKSLDLQVMYDFIQEHKKTTKNEAINLVQSILLKVKQEKLNLNDYQLNMFSNSIKLLNLNSKPIHIIANILLTFVDINNTKRVKNAYL